MTRLVVGAATCTAAYVGVLWVGDLDHHRPLLAAVMVPFWLVFVFCTQWAGRSPGRLRRPVLAILATAALVQLPGLGTGPHSSSDAYRYVWDGRVQLAGTSPYRYAPLDDRLARLRDPLLFPGLGAQQRSGYATEPLPTDRAALLRLGQPDDRTVINRPRVPTVYPPVAQAWFTAVAFLTPWSLGTLGLQVGSALLAVAVAAALARWLARSGRDPRGALWWAWCPTVALEAGNGAHVDIVGAALVVAAVLLAATRPGRQLTAWTTGLLLGAAAAVKLTPLVLLAAFTPLRRNTVAESVPAPLVATATLVLSYLPHIAVAGALTLGYLPGYLSEEGGRNRAGILGLVLPQAALIPAILVAMAAVATWALRATEADSPQHAALVLFGALLLVTTPSYPWYALPLVALAVLSQRLEWLAVAAAGYVAYAGARVPPISALGYAAAAMVVIAVTLCRRRRQSAPQRAAPGAPVGARQATLRRN